MVFLPTLPGAEGARRKSGSAGNSGTSHSPQAWEVKGEVPCPQALEARGPPYRG